MQPLVSIIIPTFNSSTYLKATLDSVIEQTYLHWECILVDDGSQDFTEIIITTYKKKDSRFKFFKRPESLAKGPSSSRNFGVEQAKGIYLVFLDSDDLLLSTCLENRIKKCNENRDSDFLVFQMERFKELPDFTKKEKEVLEDKNEILKSFINLHGQWAVTAPIYKTNFFKKINFNPNLIVFEDLEVAIKAIIIATDFQIFTTIDCYYRNDANYQTKYSSLDVKTKMVKGFQTLLQSLIDLMQHNLESEFKSKDIKSYLIQSYKKIFRFYILENSIVFKQDNKKILHLLVIHGFLNVKTAFKFFFVDRVLLPFSNIKGSGISRLIKKLYN